MTKAPEFGVFSLPMEVSAAPVGEESPATSANASDDTNPFYTKMRQKHGEASTYAGVKFALVDAHRHSACHRNEIMASGICGCFYCCETFRPDEITEWCHEQHGPFAQAPDPWTAYCPRCGIDSVIGKASGLPVDDPKFLVAMHSCWFSGEPGSIITVGHSGDRVKP